VPRQFKGGNANFLQLVPGEGESQAASEPFVLLFRLIAACVMGETDRKSCTFERLLWMAGWMWRSNAKSASWRSN
jgi:hypothetical protein